MTVVVINSTDEFVITKEKEMELRKWLEDNSDIIIENAYEDSPGELEDDLVIDFEPETSILYTKGDTEE